MAQLRGVTVESCKRAAVSTSGGGTVVLEDCTMRGNARDYYLGLSGFDTRGDLFVDGSAYTGDGLAQYM